MLRKLLTGKELINHGLNADITNKCKLKCAACPRQANKRTLVGSYSMPLDDVKKILDNFKHINFCGQSSDSIYHPDFIEILKYVDKDKNELNVSTNGHGFSKEWWLEVFSLSAERNIRFTFALDGLPKDSHIYRINQDGEQVWEMMKLGASMGVVIEWQYIVFNYNENDIEEAMEMANKYNIKFIKMLSNRFTNIEHLRPSKGNYIESEIKITKN